MEQVLARNVYICPSRPSQAECDIRSVFKRSIADLNSEFFFLLDWLLN